MRSQLDLYRDRANETRAAISLLTTYGGTPAIPARRGLVRLPDGSGKMTFADPGQPPLIPGAEELRPMLERWGTPVEDLLAPHSTHVPDVVLDQVFARLTSDALRTSQAEMPTEPNPSNWWLPQGLPPRRTGPVCSSRRPARSPRWTWSSHPGPACTPSQTPPGWARSPCRFAAPSARMAPATRQRPVSPPRIAVPDIGEGERVSVRLVVPPDGPTRLCLGGGGPTVAASTAPGLRDLSIRSAAGLSLTPASAPPEVQFSHSVVIEEGTEGCITVDAVDKDPYLSMLVPDGQGLQVTAAEGGQAQVFVDLGTGYAEADSVRVALTGEPMVIRCHLARTPPAGPSGWIRRTARPLWSALWRHEQPSFVAH